MATENGVTIVGTTNVKPRKAIGRKECQLVTFDLPYLAFYYNQKLLIYKGGEDLEEIGQKLKDGMGIVLEEFYQLAGKLDKDEDGVFKVVYDDHMDGVEIVNAVAEGVDVAELTAEEGTSKFKDLLPYNGVLNLEGLNRPLLAVQVCLPVFFVLKPLSYLVYVMFWFFIFLDIVHILIVWYMYIKHH